MERRKPPRTDEGWYALHDFRSIDWDAWRAAPDRRRERAIAEGIDYLAACEGLADADEGGSATFSVLGHRADLMILHLRPSMADLDALERRFERTAFAAFTDRVDSYLSVTEVSGYMSEEYFDEEGEVEDAGTARYIESRLKPEIPDAEYVSFYPMDKRRDPEFNWYDLPFEERAEYMSGHGDIGRGYAGRVTQIITGSVGFDDHEWGVTLFADDPTDVKDLLYEMRFDPSTSRFAEFGRFSFGRRFAPENLGTYLAGEAVPPEAADERGGSGRGSDPHGRGGRADASHGHGDAGHERGKNAEHGENAERGGGHRSERSRGADRRDRSRSGGSDVRDELADLDVYAGTPHGEDVHAIVLYSAAGPDELFEEVAGLRANFDHYDTHVKTAVYESRNRDAETAVVSLWETERAANTAAGFLSDLPEVVRQAGDDGAPADAGGERDGSPASAGSWGTMGMFYTVKPERREEFVETFAEVGELLDEMEGHRKTDLLANREDENDMFIASRWDSKDDAMQFFRSDAFSDTVEWGRDVLADRPRHVFLA